MAKASKKSPEEKLRVVLSVLRGELSAAAAGNSPGSTNATTLEAGPPSVLVPEGSVPPVTKPPHDYKNHHRH